MKSTNSILKACLYKVFIFYLLFAYNFVVEKYYHKFIRSTQEYWSRFKVESILISDKTVGSCERQVCAERGGAVRSEKNICIT